MPMVSNRRKLEIKLINSNMKRNIFVVITGVLLLLFTTPSLVSAQVEELTEEERIDSSLLYSTPADISDTINDNMETRAQNVEKTALKGITAHSVGLLQGMFPCIFKNCEDLENVDSSYNNNNQGNRVFAKRDLRKGFGGRLEDQILAMFNKQPSVNVVAHLADEWIPGHKDVNSVYASGYDDLVSAKIVDLWSFTRNIAYVFYVVIMIIIGFMIMFRNKIGGQVMVTLGNSIPRLVLSLILVTFSFAIAGIIIDIGGILRNVISGVLIGDSGFAIHPHNPFYLLGGFWGKTVIEPYIEGIEQAWDLGFWRAAWNILKNHGQGILDVLFALAASVFVLIGGIKLWVALIKAYFAILLSVITAPLTIASGSIPGNEHMIGNTFKSIARNVLVFPLAFAIVNLPFFLEKQGVKFVFPETLVGVDTASTSFLPEMLLNVGKIIAIFAAASAPEFVKAIIPATASKSGVDNSKLIKDSMSKVPLIGGMFKS